MRRAAPYFEKGLLKRVFSRSVRQRAVEFLRRPVYSMGKLKDRWYECAYPDFPLLTPKANSYLAKRLSNGAVGLEWGSGRSTLWFARNCRKLISIEHAPDWFRFVLARLQASSLRNVELRLVPLDHAESTPTAPSYEQLPRYVAQIHEFPDESLDFVLVDGHYRQACILAALPKLKLGGLLIVDDTQWMPLREWGVPADWRIELRGRSAIKETTIWISGSPEAC
jgi:hypothetical protein